MKIKLPVLFLAVALLLPTIVAASPSEEIGRAVTKAGAPNIKQANKATFLGAYRSVLATTKNTQLPDYVSAAIHLRPDLAGELAAATVTVWAQRGHGDDGKEILSDKEISCDEIDRIIRAAILADPDARDAIVRAALAAAPYARECILAAAGGEPEAPGEGPSEVAFNNGVGGPGSIGTINPSNIGGGGGGGGGGGEVNSQNQPSP